jgi:hypothetical protein
MSRFFMSFLNTVASYGFFMTVVSLWFIVREKSIKKLLCDKKIPLETRYRLPIICDDSGVIAIPFVAVADRVKPKAEDSTVALQFGLN